MAAGRGYDEVTPADAAWVDETPDEILLQLVGTCRDQEVLSLACGQGRDARMLVHARPRVTGVDASAEMIDLARSRTRPGPRAEYLVDDAQHLARVDDASVDGVVCHMALMTSPTSPPPSRPCAGCCERAAGSSCRSPTRASSRR
ncbi:class I SAM-dependent methyltransferase [Desertihabitans brevis]|uniref:Class I SAM-dependent methyltransferase n=1 Tax=Desertihabitans brevis TaxID=2268447 RepID=A0A367YYM6_9ACTN|nr:class I SAM-dependent methyltransferase [Desertihabitans brevis]RCK70996.1 class I SAM-dependent methyltransferase [Desertihabitans brevis]